MNDNPIVYDVLREIGNIGAGHAATSLATMIGKKVDMKVPHVRMLDFKEVPTLLGGEENLISGIFFKIEGDLTGSIMFVLPEESSYNLLELLMPGSTKGDQDLITSALKEIGNILAGAYISSISGLTNLNVQISIPDLAVDMAGAILSVPAVHFGQNSDSVMIIQNEFIDVETNKMVDGYFFLIPDIESYPILLKSLGVPYE